MKRSQRKRRSQVLVVESLESRRLLSATPRSHTGLMHGMQHAFVQSPAGNVDAHFNQTQPEGHRFDSGGRVDDGNRHRHVQNKDRLFGSREQIDGQRNLNSRPNSVPNSIYRPPIEPIQIQVVRSDFNRDDSESPSVPTPRPLAARLQSPGQLSPPATQTRPLVAPPISNSTPGVEGGVLSGRQSPTQATATATTGGIVDFAFAAAIRSTPSFDVGEEDEQTQVPDFVTKGNAETFGGVVNLNQLPKLIDTLPGVVDAFSPTPSADETDEGEAEEAEEFGAFPPDDFSRVDDPEASEDDDKKSVEDSVATQSSERTNAASTDVVFENSDDVENFGGVVEMPEPLSLTDTPSLGIPFDSITPSAPRVDQIISQTPMMEVDDGSEETEAEPISINIQANGHAAFMLLPALAIQAAGKNSDARKTKETATILLPRLSRPERRGSNRLGPPGQDRPGYSL